MRKRFFRGGETPLVFHTLHRLFSVLILSAILWSFGPAHGAETITFDEFYGKTGVLGFEFSEKVKKLSGQRVTISGFMAPPLKAESEFFVLTRTPMALCPFCSSDADWPEDILVIYLTKRQTFVQYNGPVEVSGVLEYGSWTDPETGFVSLLRLRDSKFHER